MAIVIKSALFTMISIDVLPSSIVLCNSFVTFKMTAESVNPDQLSIIYSVPFGLQDMNTFTFYDFRSGHKSVWDQKVSEVAEYKGSGHGGGDHLLVRDFVRALSAQDANLLSSTIDVSIESHVMGFMAEKSRKSNKKVAIKL